MSLDLSPFSAATASADVRGQNTPVDRASVIHNDLLNAILEQRLSPGTKLGEDELGQIYGASRTIVRQALQSLAHDGIIETAKNRGAFIAQPTPRDAQEVFDARRLLEARIAVLAASQGASSRADSRDALCAHLAAERTAVASGQDHLAIRLSGEFHLLIAGQAGHLVFANMLRELVARSSLIILLYRKRDAPVFCSDHHAAIAEAIMQGRSERASLLMMAHIDEIEGGLNLTEKPSVSGSLSAILGGAAAQLPR